MITPLKKPTIPKEFPLRLKEVKKGQNIWQKIKYKYFVSPFVYEFEKDYPIYFRGVLLFTIYKGYETDLSSVPPFLWWLLPAITKEGGKGTFAHDFIYSEDFNREIMGDFLNKVWGDWIMFQLRKKVGWFDNWIRFLGVLFLGRAVYKRKKKNE